MTLSRDLNYPQLSEQMAALLAGEQDVLACCSNFVALLYHALADINWLGIYVLREDELVLGPFQGKPACIRIASGSGVCGTAAAERRVINVADVSSFSGHIACDSASRSEIVLPLISQGSLLGVLDVDSPELAGFSAADQEGLSGLCERFVLLLEENTAGDLEFL